ncbi:tumor necrosis factor receptor superfamily member 8 [Ochotona princeps]|uniref:tumor necrosis factor receptor superfamily member 8 n=1 Tax=Ochotona princeps TaxID=9978 RepID=UPI002714E59F|nr:tumor necrosis factor receptor superfamily member 8 [Ochotona princeps]
MCALRPALGLLLLGALQAFPQNRAPRDLCAEDLGLYYDKAAGSCCYRCPSGLVPAQLCPQGLAGCRKHCDPDYYLNEAGRCVACVSCSSDDLVEKAPCSWNSSRICECRPGMYCVTSAANSCARCQPRPACPPGTVNRSPGAAQDAVCEPPSPASSPDCASLEGCKAPTSGTTPQAQPTLRSPNTTRPTLPRGTAPPAVEAASGPPRTWPSPSTQPSADPDPGLSPTLLCPQGSPTCQKQCQPDHYLDRTGHCMACVSCLHDDLVEKAPCSWNSSRICECRPGMYCAKSAANSCARCQPLPICPPGTVTGPQGAAERGTTSEPPPPGSHPACRPTPEDNDTPVSVPTLSSRLDAHSSSVSTPVSSSTRKPILDPGPVLFCVILVLAVALGSSSLLLCHRRACRKQIWQKLHLCKPTQTFQPTAELEDSRSWRNPAPRSDVVMTELDPKPPVETCQNVGTTCPEDLPLLKTALARGPSSSWELPEHRVSTENTNNKIEKIYIMKADTVIVGTVKTEASEGWAVAGTAEPTAAVLEEQLEVDHAPHYPEQETEPPLGSCGDVMFSVEEEGKEDPLPTMVSEK